MRSELQLLYRWVTYLGIILYMFKEKILAAMGIFGGKNVIQEIRILLQKIEFIKLAAYAWQVTLFYFLLIKSFDNYLAKLRKQIFFFFITKK